MLCHRTCVLLCILLMMPQWVETMYSPILTEIAQHYQVSAAQSSLTLSLYFLAFALGIVFWGYGCDRYGRRPALLSGLTLYCLATIAAYYSVEFNQLLAARLVAAFAIAVASIGTQTIIRDRFQGSALAQFFAVMGVLMAISPALGMIISAQLTEIYHYRAVFMCLAIVAVILLLWSAFDLKESRPTPLSTQSFTTILIRMLGDRHVLKTALLIALFNINLFAYYQLAPFHFQQMQLSTQQFGQSGMVLSLGTAAGAGLNHYLLKKGWQARQLLDLATWMSLCSAILTLILLYMQSASFAMIALLTLMGYAIAIPNLLASALIDYRDCTGRAGALLGLLYYGLLGLGLLVAGWGQHLGWTLLLCSVLIFITLKKPSP